MVCILFWMGGRRVWWGMDGKRAIDNFYGGDFKGLGNGMYDVAGWQNTHLSISSLNFIPHVPKYIQDSCKYHILVPLLSILLITFGYLREEKRVLIYPNNNFKNIIRKKKWTITKKRTLLIIPKLLILLLLVYSEDLQNKRNLSIGKMEGLDYISVSNIVKNDFLTEQYQLYALSKLKYGNRYTFVRYLLLLSGDVEPNPGPKNACAVCEKKMALSPLLPAMWLLGT